MDRSQLKFAKTHEWIAVEGNTATVGITDFAVRTLQHLVEIQLPAKGRQLAPGEPFSELEGIKAVIDLYAPTGGELLESNLKLSDNLAPLSEDPFGAGWIIKLKLAPGTSLGHLMDAAAYAQHCASEPDYRINQ